MFILGLLIEGGWVMWPLAMTAVLLWFGLGFRLNLYNHLNYKIKNKTLDLCDQNLYYLNRYKFTTLIKSLLVISPLLGLLGTVSGMIETFDSMAEMQLYSQGGGIASGISKALFTTQMGLVISAPGLLFFKFVERKITALEVNSNVNLKDKV